MRGLALVLCLCFNSFASGGVIWSHTFLYPMFPMYPAISSQTDMSPATFRMEFQFPGSPNYFVIHFPEIDSPTYVTFDASNAIDYDTDWNALQYDVLHHWGEVGESYEVDSYLEPQAIMLHPICCTSHWLDKPANGELDHVSIWVDVFGEISPYNPNLYALIHVGIFNNPEPSSAFLLLTGLLMLPRRARTGL